MKALLVWIWCFPQMLAGAIFNYISKARKCGDHYIISNEWGGSVSLGSYVFLCEAHERDERVLKHEKGHTKQSYMLGWLYLLVIGLPSVIWCNCFGWYRKKHGVSYYAFYTEKWADKLGGVER